MGTPEFEVELIGGPLDGERRAVPDNFRPGETIVFQGWFGHIAYDIASAQLGGNGPLRYEYSGPFEG